MEITELQIVNLFAPFVLMIFFAACGFWLGHNVAHYKARNGRLVDQHPCPMHLPWYKQTTPVLKKRAKRANRVE